MFGSLFITTTVALIHEALGDNHADGRVAVVSQPRVGAALSERGVAVLQLSDRVRGLRKLTMPRMCASEDHLPMAPDSMAAVVGFGIGDAERWMERLAEWRRVVRDGGTMILVDRGSPTEFTRRALCAGLCEIQQRHAGRTVITSGLVTKI